MQTNKETNKQTNKQQNRIFMMTAVVSLFTFYGPPGILSSPSLHFVDNCFFTAANHSKWNLFLKHKTWQFAW